MRMMYRKLSVGELTLKSVAGLLLNTLTPVSPLLLVGHFEIIHYTTPYQRDIGLYYIILGLDPFISTHHNIKCILCHPEDSMLPFLHKEILFYLIQHSFTLSQLTTRILKT